MKPTSQDCKTAIKSKKNYKTHEIQKSQKKYFTSSDPHRNIITYLPHKAVAEVSKDKEPIGRKCAEFNWFEIQLMSDSNELRVK